MKSIERPEIEQFRQFHMLDLISYRHLNYLRDKSQICIYPPGELIFREDDNSEKNYYLLNGCVEICDITGNRRKVNSSSRESYCAINEKIPSGSTACASTTCRILEISHILVDQYFSLSTTGTFKSIDLDIDDGEPERQTKNSWLTKLTNSSLTKNLSKIEFERLLSLFIERQVSKSETLMHIGKLASHFFVLKSGKAESHHSSGEKKLLSFGDYWGDEALIPSAVSDTRVTMLSDGLVATLDKKAFDEIIKHSLVKHIDPKHIQIMDEQSYTIIDVRLAAEYKLGHTENSINIPINCLKSHLHELKKNKLIFVSEESSERGALAVLILQQAGFRSFLIGQPNSNTPFHSSQRRA